MVKYYAKYYEVNKKSNFFNYTYSFFNLIIHIVFLIKTSYIFLDTIIILYIKEQ